jgi:hypothetical protein
MRMVDRQRIPMRHQEQGPLLRNTLLAWTPDGRFHPRHRSLADVLLQIERAPDSPSLVLDCAEYVQHRWIFAGGWYTADAWLTWLGRVAVSVRSTCYAHHNTLTEINSFLIEGTITFFIGVLSYGLMPPGATQTKHWFRGKDGWFNDHEETILVNRILRDDPSKGDMNNREAVSISQLWKAICDWEQWLLYLIGIIAYIPPSPPSNYLSYILRQLGFSVFEANLLAIPSQFLFAVQLLVVTWLSRKFEERSIISSLSNIWIFPWLVALVVLPGSANPWIRYALLSGLLSYPYCHAILVGWNAKNSNSVRTRAVSAAFYNMFVQSGNIIATNIYRDDDQPLYRRGNKILLGICVFNVFLFYAVKAFYIWRNQVRERQWNAMTKEEQEDYVISTKDEGMKRLDFRFVH